MTWSNWFTLFLATLGAVLGVVNTLHALRRDRVRLRVQARRWVRAGGDTGWGVDLANRSAFPFTVQAVVIPLPDRREFWITELARQLPKRLEARTSAFLEIAPGTMEHGDFPAQGRFRVRTACGHVQHSPRVRFHPRPNGGGGQSERGIGV